MVIIEFYLLAKNLVSTNQKAKKSNFYLANAIKLIGKASTCKQVRSTTLLARSRSIPTRLPCTIVLGSCPCRKPAQSDRAGTIERNHPYVQAAFDAIIARIEQIEGNQAGERLRRELSAKLDRCQDFWLPYVADSVLK